MPRQPKQPRRSKAPLMPGEVRALPPGTPPPPDLYAPEIPVSPTGTPILDPGDIAEELRALRDLETYGEPPPISGYDPLRTPEYLAQEAPLMQPQQPQQPQHSMAFPIPPSSVVALQRELDQLRREKELVERERDLAVREAELARREVAIERERDQTVPAYAIPRDPLPHFDPNDIDEDSGEEGDDEDDEEDSGEEGDEGDEEEEEEEAYPGRKDASFPPLAPPLAPEIARGKVSAWLDLGDFVGNNGERYPQFKGWKIRVRTDVSTDLLQSLMQLQENVSRLRRSGSTRAFNIMPMLDILRDILDAWNFRMPDGRAMPQPPEGLRHLRGDLFLVTMQCATGALAPSKTRSRRLRRRS